MIPYEKRRWTAHLFDIEGSMLIEITGRVTATVIWCALVVFIHHFLRPISIPATIHTLVGGVIALLLVFRTNASYDRFWEGRKLWGSITNESRNLARGSRVYLLEGAPDLARKVGLWTMAFAHACENRLRDGDGLGPAGDLIPHEDVRAALASNHTPLFAATKISANLAEARDRGLISDFVLDMLDRNVQQLIDYIGGCERIRRTPLPFVYVVHLRRTLIIYCFTLPFAIVDQYGWWTILVTLLAAYTFFGIEEIGVEIENPFGYDANDLPLKQFCETIDRNLAELLEIPLPQPMEKAGPDDSPTDAPSGRLATTVHT